MSLYAFNGFVLEQLPIWDNSLPYAAIVYRENVHSREIMLICSDAELKYDPDNGLKVPAGTTIQRCPLMIIDGVMSWHTYIAEKVVNTAYYSTPIWANYDLKTTENKAFILASDPVPFDQITTDKTWVRAGGEKLPEFPDANAEYPNTYVVYSLEFNGYLMIRSKNPAYVALDISTTNVFFQDGYIVSKYLPAYGKPYWDSFVTPRQVVGGMADYSDIIWHSVINNRAGLPYYEASTAPTPWPKFDLKTFCAFLATGLCMPPIPKGARVPIAYSYNGVVLPKLPEWDRSVYPYALLHRGENETDGVYYVFLVGNMKPHHLANGVHFCGYGYAENGDSYKAFKSYTYNPYTTWGEFGYTYTWFLSSNIFWTNTDILDEDGSVYMEASEPVPVYE